MRRADPDYDFCHTNVPRIVKILPPIQQLLLKLYKEGRNLSRLALRYVQSESDRSNVTVSGWGNDNPDDARLEAHRGQADELYLTGRAAAPKSSWQAHSRQTTDRRLPPVTKVICDLSADSMIRVELVGY
jgi:hypothetical protein